MDVLVIETGNGGDRLLRGNDVATVGGIENMPYLAMFGGGTNDWWGNTLLYGTRPELQYRSQTEQVLNTVVLNSAGRIKIQQAIQADLAFLKKYYPDTDIRADVYLTGSNRAEIIINLNGQTISMVWEPAKEFLTYQVK